MFYGPSGNVTEVDLPDGQSIATYTYDDRGRASRVDVRSKAGATFAELVRNAAGHVVRRTTPTTGVAQTWARDGEGRVTNTAVIGKWYCHPPTPCALQTIAGESITFDSLGDVSTATE